MMHQTFFRDTLEFWPHLSEGQRAYFLQNTAEVTYRAGENIHGGTSRCKGFIMVAAGSLRAYMLSEEGREITLYRLHPGDTCVLSASCVLENINFEVHIDAAADSRIYLTGPAAFAQLKAGNIHVESFANKLMAERFSDVMWAMQQILFVSFDKRLAQFLLEEATLSGEQTIRLTHEQMARYLGSAREVVTRMLRYFAAEGLTESFRGGIRITDAKRLRLLATA